jgi:hypothetical protein
MAKCARWLAMLLLAAFVAGTVAHAGSATTMSLMLALDDCDSGAMSGCGNCSNGTDQMPPCDNACVTPVVAVLSADELDVPHSDRITAHPITDRIIGRLGPPDPQPPRSANLS